ncbi:MAG TPA: type II toxin-antitoxin system VapB family antitoxin [Saprospiraceae bacterium]|nr:type II toxin-antitoxin system VapB family antitoxin [Saprospiraceae bacterium]
MRANIEINPELLETALQLSRLGSKKAVVDEALKQFVNHLRRRQMLELRGKVNWEGNLSLMRETR